MFRHHLEKYYRQFSLQLRLFWSIDGDRHMIYLNLLIQSRVAMLFLTWGGGEIRYYRNYRKVRIIQKKNKIYRKDVSLIILVHMVKIQEEKMGWGVYGRGRDKFLEMFITPFLLLSILVPFSPMGGVHNFCICL